MTVRSNVEQAVTLTLNYRRTTPTEASGLRSIQETFRSICGIDLRRLGNMVNGLPHIQVRKFGQSASSG